MSSLSSPNNYYSSESGDSLEDPYQTPAPHQFEVPHLMARDFTVGLGSAPHLSTLDKDSRRFEPRPDANIREVYPSQTYAEHTDFGPRLKLLHSGHEITYHSQIIPLPNIITHDLYSSTVDASRLLTSASEYTAEPSSAKTASSSGDSPTTETEHGPKGGQTAGPQPLNRSRKTRREKPHIELAPDQPPTTQGRPRARVYVACLQCRTRKIRCDGAKPVCHNCSRRTATSGGLCSYDSAPKRRGPDKTPGARQRTARELSLEREAEEGAPRRRRRKRDSSSLISSDHITGTKRPAPYEVRNKNDLSLCPIPLTPISALSDASSETWSNLVPTYSEHHRRQVFNFNNDDQLCRPYGSQLDDDSPAFAYIGGLPRGYADQLYDGEEQKIFHIAAEPSLDFTRKTWWDCLLATYSLASSTDPMSLTGTQRELAATAITSDLRFLFKTSNYWMSFVNVPRFFRAFFDPTTRDNLQPSLIIISCALGMIWQSSEIGKGKSGRDLALQLRDQAQGALQASLNAGWIDENLAIAAWMLAMFEVCAHPQHSKGRSTASMIVLDQIIRTLSLTTIDVDDPNVSRFAPREVPRIPPLRKSPRHAHPPTHDPQFNREMNTGSTYPSHISTTESCDCAALSLGHRWPGAFEHTPLWLSTPAWDENWTEGEIKKESCRRLCWSTVILAAGISSYTTAYKADALDLFITEPSNFALLFPGEALASFHDSKNSIWSLNYRTMLLWHSCVRMRCDPHATDGEKARFGMAAWLEVDELEEALNSHGCGLERAFLFQGREYLFNTRMCISYEFQRFIPLATVNASGNFHRRKAQEWLTHQATVAKQVMHGLHIVTGQGGNGGLTQRPFFVFWFMSQINRALSLWTSDRTLTVALEVSKALLAPIDHLTALWPCPEQRLRYADLREQLDQACLIAGLSLPPPSNFSLPLMAAPGSVIPLPTVPPPSQSIPSPPWGDNYETAPTIRAHSF